MHFLPFSSALAGQLEVLPEGHVGQWYSKWGNVAFMNHVTHVLYAVLNAWSTNKRVDYLSLEQREILSPFWLEVLGNRQTMIVLHMAIWVVTRFNQWSCVNEQCADIHAVLLSLLFSLSLLLPNRSSGCLSGNHSS